MGTNDILSPAKRPTKKSEISWIDRSVSCPPSLFWFERFLHPPHAKSVTKIGQKQNAPKRPSHPVTREIEFREKRTSGVDRRPPRPETALAFAHAQRIFPRCFTRIKTPTSDRVRHPRVAKPEPTTRAEPTKIPRRPDQPESSSRGGHGGRVVPADGRRAEAAVRPEGHQDRAS